MKWISFHDIFKQIILLSMMKDIFCDVAAEFLKKDQGKKATQNKRTISKNIE